MKKLFVLIFTFCLLLTACQDRSSAENNKRSSELFILTDKTPLKTEEYLSKMPPTSFDNVFYISDGMEILSENTLSKELTASCTITEISSYTKKEELHTFESKKAGIIDSKDSFVECFEKGKDARYSDHFPADFFEKNIILFVRIHERYSSPFWSVEYEFNSADKKLNVTFSEADHEGWMRNRVEIEGPYNYLIVIAKSDITVDGKLVPYEELNIEVTGNLTVE